MYSCSNNRPIFGGGFDVAIFSYASSNTDSYTDLGYTYSPPSGHSYGSSFTKSFLIANTEMDAKRNIRTDSSETIIRISVAISVTSLTLVTLLFMRIDKGSKGLVGIQGPKGECVVPLKIRVYPVSQEVFVHEPVIFYCWVQGHLSSKITWRKLGGTLSDATVEDGALRISSVQRSHAGSYMCTGHTGLEQSEILANNDHHLRTLSFWLGSVVQSQSSYWKRCWRASVDGWAGTTFHSKCNNKGPTVTIIRVGKYIFGGYTSTSWNSICGYLYSSKAFLFSLVNKPAWAPVKLSQTGKYSSYRDSIYSCPSEGPIFGRGYDIWIANYASSNTISGSNLGYTYSPPSGHSPGSSFTQSFLAGSYYFQPDEVEVFYESTK
ncbi:unnamed protein product [Pocillopora meandrina]|uniref:Uncharacterized protein n=1 Tax=Pocillopora meandrina TaxID=46732 RepID=A0AAU9XC95_9CNID|nr:unnamed protein product [Pocillopora meandrina]